MKIEILEFELSMKVKDVLEFVEKHPNIKKYFLRTHPKVKRVEIDADGFKRLLKCYSDDDNINVSNFPRHQL